MPSSSTTVNVVVCADCAGVIFADGSDQDAVEIEPTLGPEVSALHM